MAAAPVAWIGLVVEGAKEIYREVKAAIRGQQAQDQVAGQTVLDKAKAETAEIDELARKSSAGTP